MRDYHFYLYKKHQVSNSSLKDNNFQIIFDIECTIKRIQIV